MSDPILEPKVPEPKTPSGGVKHSKKLPPSPDLMPPADAEDKEAAHAAEPKPKPQATTPAPAPANAQAKADAQAKAPADDQAKAQAQAKADAQAKANPWLQPLGWLSLSGLDDIDPVNVRNSMAFKLGALAGSLPALRFLLHRLARLPPAQTRRRPQHPPPADVRPRPRALHGHGRLP